MNYCICLKRLCAPAYTKRKNRFITKMAGSAETRPLAEGQARVPGETTNRRRSGRPKPPCARL